MVNFTDARESRDKKKDFLALNLSQPEKEPESEIYKVIAELWLRYPAGHTPRVKITLDGNLWQGQEFFSLNRQRCLTMVFNGLTPGIHTIVAATEDGQHRSVGFCNIPLVEKKKRFPTQRKIELVGDYGDYRLFVTVSDEDGNAFPNQPVVITQQANGEIKSRLEKKTDKTGRVIAKILFLDDKERWITVNFPGASDKLQLWGKRLFGQIPGGV